MQKDVLHIIKANMAGFSKGQRRIANYILENYDKAAFMTASKLGKIAQVSESTVVRFASALGVRRISRHAEGPSGDDPQPLNFCTAYPGLE